jgi:hypothetical protein
MSGSRRLNPIQQENLRTGDHEWDTWTDRYRTADDIAAQIKGYASATSVNIGESIDFHVSVNPGGEFSISVFRLGYYDGRGARKVAESPVLHGEPQTMDFEPSARLISCRWPVSWTLEIGTDWTSGLYVAVFSADAGWRNITPFVVRDDDRRASLCVLIPFTTYQAYNQWPLDGKLGKSLYYGYPPDRDVDDHAYRAFKVSFDRPYMANGLPHQLDFDLSFVVWAEARGYDLTYADSMDLDSSGFDSAKYVGLVFSGHDEYWTRGMRAAATAALESGTSLVFLTANNIYWHIRLEQSSGGKSNRVVVCYKGEPDHSADANRATGKWRTKAPSPGKPEQALLGVQYRAVVPEPVPLVVQAADHWFWQGCDVTDGVEIKNLVGGEADCRQLNYPLPKGMQQTLLAESPFVMSDGTEVVHNTSICEGADGRIVFVGGTLHWTFGLGQGDQSDERIQKATANLLDRIVVQPGPQPRRRGWLRKLLSR